MVSCDIYCKQLGKFYVRFHSLTLKSEIKNVHAGVDNECMDDFMIETHPISVCYVLCGEDGEPDLNS